MGKRKRTLSPKENNNDQSVSFGTLKIKSGSEVKKFESCTSDGSEGIAFKTDGYEKSNTSLAGESEVINSTLSDERPIPQLRISARVQNKQKREENKTEIQSSVSSAKKDGSSQDEDEEEDKSKIPGGGEGEKGVSHNGDSQKRRRAWELWSLEDKNTFFEAINECGKDFEAIQNFLLTKLRKKGIPTCVIKNKDQVRYFYYRTWHKISKHIKFKDNVKKSTQELYTLINYGELRRKVGGTLDEKKGQKLQELIQKGSTSVRVKGKSIRVRTPICRALKKLNEFPDDRDQTGIRVPVSVNIEIVPANISSWNHVQSLAHNPRVRVSCLMHKTLLSIIHHLENKWTNTKFKIANNLISTANFSVAVSPPPSTILRLRPPTHTSFNNVIIKPDTHVKSFAVSLSSHSQMLERKGEMEFQSSKTVGKTGCKTSRKKKSSLSVSNDSVKEKSTEEVESSKDEDDCKAKAIGEREKRDKDDDKGEASQEEMEDGSDVEVEEEVEVPPPSVANFSASSDETKDDEVVVLSCHSPPQKEVDVPLPSVVIVKEEPPPTAQLPPNYDEEVFNAVKNIKEEVADPMETIHQLMALENVASSREIEDDADVICIGENTRLSAQVRDNQKKSSEDATNIIQSLDSLGSKTQSDQREETQVLAGEEPVNTPETVSLGDQGFSSVAERVDKAKTGWTAKTCGMITVGELYLMFGKNQLITLEYEFEDESNPGAECSVLSPKMSTKVEDHDAAAVDETSGGSNDFLSAPESTETSFSSPPSAKASNGSALPSLVVEASNLASPLPKESSNVGEREGSPLADALPSSNSSSAATNDRRAKDKKRLEAENLSSMMAKLLYMIKIISSKGSSGDLCFCSNNSTNNSTPSKGALNALRSPSSNSRCVNGFLKSPGSNKSPRGCSISLRSPKTPTMSSPGVHAGEGPAPPQRNDRVKPASAKRLIPETLSEKSLVGNNSGNGGIVVGKDKAAESVVEKAGPNPDVPPTGGEFRVPIGPAPRNHSCQSPNPSFNAQLSKLLPRYSRPSRRASARKNMVVQRQLPVMPHPAKTSQGFVTLKVGNLQEFNINSASSQMSLPLSVNIAAPSTTLPLPSKEARPVQPIAPKDTLTRPASAIVLQQQQAVPMALAPSPFAVKVPDTVAAPAAVSTDSNSISVNVSGQQLMTVKMPSYPVATPVTTVSSLASITQSASVTCAASADFVVTTTTSCALPIISDSFHSSNGDEFPSARDENSLSNILTRSLSELPYLTTPPCTPGMQLDNLLSTPNSKSELVNFSENSNSSLLSMSDMELSSIRTPFKSSLIPASPVPPSTFNESSLLNTPVNVGSKKREVTTPDVSPIKLNLSSLLSSSGDLLNSSQAETGVNKNATTPQSEDVPQIHIPECSESLPILDISLGGTISVKEQSTNVQSLPTSSVVVTVPPLPSVVNDITAISPVSTILTPTTASGMSSVPNIVGMESTIMDNVLPKSNIVSEMLEISNSVGTLSHQIENSLPLSAAATLVTILPITTAIDNLPRTSTNEGLGGGLLSTVQDANTDISLSVTCVTTSVTCGESSSSRKGTLPEEPRPQQQFQEVSDKLMDFALSNSNSNSSFTSLLAAAANHPCLESVMENSLLQTPPRPMLSGGVSGGIGSAKSNLSFDGDAFESLSTAPLSPPSSPSRLLRQAEAQWMNNEASEFSLSSLLGSMDSSPLKGAGVQTPSLSQSSHFHALMSTLNDNSVDFTATFANLKKQTKDKE